MKQAIHAVLSISLGILLAGAVPPALAESAVAPGGAVEAKLAEHVTPAVRSDVMVVGTAHLRAFEDKLEHRHLEETLAELGRFAPTRIAIEHLPPDEVALLLEQAPHDTGAQKVLDQFASRIVEDGRIMQQALGLDRAAAQARARVLLAQADGLSEASRIELVGLLLAAYEHDSATLQWSYLEPEAREASSVPVAVRQALDGKLEGSDEVARLAIPLARSLGLQRLYPVDSQYEAVRTYSLPADALEDASGKAWGDAWRASEESRRLTEATRQAAGTGDLLTLLRYFNSEAGQRDDAAQWRSWLAQEREDGVHRFRYAMWELRNQRMVAHLMDAAASRQPERLLFLVGTSHKSYVDRALAPHLGIRLVQPFESAPPSTP